MGFTGKKTACGVAILTAASVFFCLVGIRSAMGVEPKEASQQAAGASVEKAKEAVNDHPQVVLNTSMGQIVLELDRKQAPVTVENFLQYVKDGFYNGTLFHRVIPDFMIQGGGMEPGMKQKPTRSPIKNEAANGLKNTTGAVAMARTSVVDSATSQFFINCKDNAFLDHRDATPRGTGYAVFGKVVKGMDVVRKIEKAPTGAKGPYRDVPLEDILIVSAEIQRP